MHAPANRHEAHAIDIDTINAASYNQAISIIILHYRIFIQFERSSLFYRLREER